MAFQCCSGVKLTYANQMGKYHLIGTRYYADHTAFKITANPTHVVKRFRDIILQRR